MKLISPIILGLFLFNNHLLKLTFAQQNQSIMDQLISKISNRALNKNTIHDMAAGLSPEPKIEPVVSLPELQNMEAELDFKFPPLLVQIYTQIGNGGFGPGYGLYSLQEAKSIYLECMSEPENEWEKGTWPLCTWGCAIDSYVDCLDEGYPVYYTNEDFDDDHGDSGLSFTLTDKDGNLIQSGTSNNLNDLLNNLSDDGNQPNIDEDDEEVGLIYHKDTLDEWFSDWVKGVNLWDDMMEGGEDEGEEDNNGAGGFDLPRRPVSN
jgi:hypothetical protein